jgi:signal transduction histidine kinase/ligand-binding sensor domain-containing protein
MADPYTFFFHTKRWMALFGFVLISVNFCVAQENIRFERLSVNEGLSQSDVKSFVQDKFGFLWIGTRDGLNKYDGSEFHRYTQRKNDSTSLQFNQILDLEIDSSGNIWVGSAGGISIYNYRKDNFQNFFFTGNELKDTDVNHILLTGEHTALLSTNKGLVNFDMKRRKFFTDPDLKLFKDMRVFRACQTPEHGLWVGTDRGVFIKASVQSSWISLLEDNSVSDIDFDPNGKVYLSGSKGLFRHDLKKKKTEQIAMPPGAVTQVLRMKNGDLWVASNKVIVLDKNDVFRYVLGHDKFNNYSLSEDRARAFCQTRDDVIWVGTFGYGLNKFNPDVADFSYLSEQASLPLSSNYVSAVFTADDTTVLVGTSRGLDVIDLESRSVKHFSSNDDLFQILKIVADKKNSIWLSTSKGLMQYSGNKLISKNPSLLSVYHFAEWDTARLIVATRINGIYLFDRTTDSTSLLIPVNDLSEEVACMLVEDDHLWIGSKDGLKLYNRNGRLIKHFRANRHEQGSLRSSFVKSLYRDTNKNLWVGTWGGGLSMLNAKDSTFTTYLESSGLPNNVVYGILEDDSGTLWLSTNLGISACHPKNRVFRNFDFFDGLQSNEFNTGAYFKSASGKMYFGGVNGLNFFSPNEILKRHAAPFILTTAVTVNNKALTFQNSDSVRNVLMVNKIRLGWKENDIGVAFTAVDFKHAKKHNFQYSINDTTWYSIGNRRNLELIDLPGGHHEIKVRANKPGSSWSTEAVLLTIDIIPPVWERAWFRILAMLVLLAMIFTANRYRVTRLRNANIVLNKLVAERTKEILAKNEEIASQNDQLHELNKELEAFSYSISHDLRAPLRSIIGYSKILEEDFYEKLDAEGRRVLATIQNNASGMNNLINHLLEFSKSGRKELLKAEMDPGLLIKNVLGEISSSTQHKTEIRVNTLPRVYADSKLLSQVWINLLSNAIKYSAKKETPVVEVGSYAEKNEVVFYVKDNGAGFDMKYVDKLFGVFQRLHKAEDFEGTGVGLALVQRIVAKHGGRVWAEGKVNEGATFYFSLPNRG